jgi:hypothetical protein
MAGSVPCRAPDADTPRPFANLDLAEAAVGELGDEGGQQVVGQAVDGFVVDLSVVGRTVNW